PFRPSGSTEFLTFEISGFFGGFVKATRGFDTHLFAGCSRQRIDPCPCHPFLIGRFRVPLHLPQGAMTGDGGDDVSTASSIGQPPTRSLPQSMYRGRLG